MLAGKRILLIIGGGIAAYKALDLIRRCTKRGRRGDAGADRRRGGVRDAAVGVGAGGREGASATCSI